jgi:hypothetical protein
MLRIKPTQALPEVEWNFKEFDIPDEQLIPMLHYEYARSAKWMADAAQRLREGLSDKSSAPGECSKFASWLTRRFPEFPQTPWLKIKAAVRNEKCADLGFSAPWNWKEKRPPLEFINYPDQEFLIFLEEAPSNPIEKDFFTLLKINWQDYEDKEIIAAFAEWLGHRRQRLIRAHDKVVAKANAKQFNDNRFFIYQSQKAPTGAGNPKRLYQHYLHQLGVMRMIRSAGGRWHTSAVVSEKRMADQAELQVAELLRRLQQSWRFHPAFTDVLEPSVFQDDFFPVLRYLPPLAVKQAEGKFVIPNVKDHLELKELIDRQFVTQISPGPGLPH